MGFLKVTTQENILYINEREVLMFKRKRKDSTNWGNSLIILKHNQKLDVGNYLFVEETIEEILNQSNSIK